MIDRLAKSVPKKGGPWHNRNATRPHPVPRKNKPQKKSDPDDLEGAVQREVLIRAKIMGILLYRQQAGNVMIGKYHMQLAPIGASDLTGIVPNSGGRRLEVECKRRVGGVQSDVQKEWQAKIEALGGLYLLVNSEESFEEQIKEFI